MKDTIVFTPKASKKTPQANSEAIESQVEAFLAKGGEITQIEMGLSAFSMAAPARRRSISVSNKAPA